ncbi:MAG: hypothetical protein ACREOI_04400 [bacterium]
MPSTFDFRISPFDRTSIGESGKYIGRQSYWKLYAIENFFRIIIHSILSMNISTDWWNAVVNKKIREKAERFQQNYVEKFWHGKPGAHGIYYIDLRDLNEIIRANAILFDLVIPDLDKWMLGIEELRLPRNVVAHMNFPSSTDKKRIDVFYEDCLTLVALVESKVELKIP